MREVAVPRRLKRWSFAMLFASGGSAFVSNTLHAQRCFHLPHKNNLKTMKSSKLDRNTKTILRMISYDDISERLPSNAVIDAVEKFPSGAIASDVSASAGVSLSQARKDLTTLASLTRGDIAVSADGELIYSFPSNIRGTLSSNSLKFRASSIVTKIWPKLFYVIRVAFGIALLVSIAAIFSTIALISSSSSSSDDDRRDSRRGGGSMGFGGSMFWGPSPLDFFYYRPYYGYYGTGRMSRKDPEEMGFLESVFSYIFGDGSPNVGLEEERLALVADVIRENKGAVTAEQLAPFLDPPKEEADTFVDESFVLPVVSKLGGEPTVTEEGDIVYLFPELQTSAILPKTESSILEASGLDPNISTRELAQVMNDAGLPTRGAFDRENFISILQAQQQMQPQQKEVLQEEPYKFTLATDLNKILSAGLGIVNLGGALYLGNLLSSAALEGIRLPSYFGLVQAGYPVLLGYAILFNLIPLGRYFYIQAENAKIRERNQNRRKWLQKLGMGMGKVARKLKSARALRMQTKQLGSDDVVFDTKMTTDNIQENKEREKMQEFDNLLSDDGSDAFQ